MKTHMGEDGVIQTERDGRRARIWMISFNAKGFFFVCVLSVQDTHVR